MGQVYADHLRSLAPIAFCDVGLGESGVSQSRSSKLGTLKTAFVPLAANEHGVGKVGLIQFHVGTFRVSQVHLLQIGW